MSAHLQNRVTFTDDAHHSRSEVPHIQTGMIFYKEGASMPCQGDLVQTSVNGKSRQLVAAFRPFIYDRYVLDIIR